MDKSLSESDLSQITKDKTPPSFVFARAKRRRDDEDTSDMGSFKDEIKSLISNFMAQQQQEIKKISLVLTEIKQTNLKIESSITFLSAQNEEFKSKIEKLETQAKQDREYIAVLEGKMEDIQMSTRKSNFELKNVPKKSGETKEDLLEMVLCLSKNVDCNMVKKDIKDIYRVRSGKNGETSTPIIVETTSTILKTDFLKNCKTFNIRHKMKLCAKHLGHRTKEDVPIFVSEQLTAKGSRLHFLARDLVKSRRYKYCWTAYGKIYLRKDDNSPIISIKSEAQVHQLSQVL